MKRFISIFLLLGLLLTMAPAAYGGILPDSQHPVDELLAGVVPVVAWHNMPPFSKFPGLSCVVGSLSVLSCGIERC